MRNERGRILRGVCLGGGGLVLAAALLFSLLPKRAEPQASPLEIFSAPSSVPEGEHWVLLGSKDAIPEDAEVTPAASGVSVLEVQRLSQKALGARILAPAEAAGPLLEVSSRQAATKTLPALTLGPLVPPLSIDANIAPEDLVVGQLVVPSKWLIYGYFETEETPLAALRIHNRATGEWNAQEWAEAEAQAALQVPVKVDPEFFVNVDPHDTLPDTNGDGVYDFEDPPEVREAVPEQLGVALVSGTNTLDIVAVDRSGRVSWKVLEVFSTYSPPPEPAT